MLASGWEARVTGLLTGGQQSPSLPPAERVRASLDAFIDCIEVHEASYVRLIEDAGSVAGVRDLLGRVGALFGALMAAASVDSTVELRLG